MKNTIRLFFILLCSYSFSQIPQAFNYQAQSRDNSGNPLSNKSIAIKISILNGSATGSIDYTETHNVSTDENGLFSLSIGTGAVVSGTFITIDWSGGQKYLKIELDQDGGSNFIDMGTTQLLSVPFALQAETVTNDKYIDADADSTNEIQDLSITGDALTITNNVGASTIDLSAYKDNTDTQLSEGEVDEFVSNNGFLTAEVDGSVTNEIQDLSITGDALTITNNVGASNIDLSVYKDVYTAGSGIEITNNIISTAVSIFSIGLNASLGGYVFYVTPDGKHGLVAATQDISPQSLYDTENAVSNPVNYDNDGKNFTDWRLPTKYELSLMFIHKDNMGGFLTPYWSSSESDSGAAWFIQINGIWFQSNKTNTTIASRPIRAF